MQTYTDLVANKPGLKDWQYAREMHISRETLSKSKTAYQDIKKENMSAEK